MDTLGSPWAARRLPRTLTTCVFASVAVPMCELGGELLSRPSRSCPPAENSGARSGASADSQKRCSHSWPSVPPPSGLLGSLLSRGRTEELSCPSHPLRAGRGRHLPTAEAKAEPVLAGLCGEPPPPPASVHSGTCRTGAVPAASTFQCRTCSPWQGTELNQSWRQRPAGKAGPCYRALKGDCPALPVLCSPGPAVQGRALLTWKVGAHGALLCTPLLTSLSPSALWSRVSKTRWEEAKAPGERGAGCGRWPSFLDTEVWRLSARGGRL